MRRRERMADDLDQDIREHLERETQDNLERGMSAEEARTAALRNSADGSPHFCSRIGAADGRGDPRLLLSGAAGGTN